MTKDQAEVKFLKLVARYGVKWTDKVPQKAWLELKSLEQVLSEHDKREALIRRFKER